MRLEKEKIPACQFPDSGFNCYKKNLSDVSDEATGLCVCRIQNSRKKKKDPV